MPTTQAKSALEYLPINLIDRNEHNPRLIFRGEELEELAASIREIGVQVPISVFRDRRRYTLIDGERRWRACQMINQTKIPGIIYPKPDAVQNIVFMFNIHRFRKDWDPLPTAMKLQELKALMTAESGAEPTEADLAALTGMTRGAIRRCNLIMEIPGKEQRAILEELEKPEHERRITTDLFVECQRSVRTIRTYLPDLRRLERPLRNALIDKYKRDVIINLTHMRLVARIARSVIKGVPKRTVRAALERLINEPDLSAEDAYKSVAWAYDLRTIQTQAKSLSALIGSLPRERVDLDPPTIRLLREVANRIRALLSR